MNKLKITFVVFLVPEDNERVLRIQPQVRRQFGQDSSVELRIGSGLCVGLGTNRQKLKVWDLTNRQTAHLILSLYAHKTSLSLWTAP